VSFKEGSGGFDFFSFADRNLGAFSLFPPADHRTSQSEYEHAEYDAEGDAYLLIDAEAIPTEQHQHETLPGYTFPDAGVAP
jgi:hypothetical protein